MNNSITSLGRKTKLCQKEENAKEMNFGYCIYHYDMIILQLENKKNTQSGYEKILLLDGSFAAAFFYVLQQRHTGQQGQAKL